MFPRTLTSDSHLATVAAAVVVVWDPMPTPSHIAAPLYRADGHLVVAAAAAGRVAVDHLLEVVVGVRMSGTECAGRTEEMATAGEAAFHFLGTLGEAEAGRRELAEA